MPEEWDVVKLSGVMREPLKNGINKNKEDFGFGTKMVNVLDIFCPFLVDNTNLGRINVSSKEIERYRLKTGDVLVVRSSLKKEGVGLATLQIPTGWLTISRPCEKQGCQRNRLNNR